MDLDNIDPEDLNAMYAGIDNSPAEYHNDQRILSRYKPISRPKEFGVIQSNNINNYFTVVYCSSDGTRERIVVDTASPISRIPFKKIYNTVNGYFKNKEYFKGINWLRKLGYK